MCPAALELFAQLAEVLDDAVQDDRELLVVAGGQRMRVQLGDPAVRGPAGVAEPGGRLGAIRLGGVLQELQIPDRAHVFEAVGLEQRDPGGVVAAVLESFEPREQKTAWKSDYRRIR